MTLFSTENLEYFRSLSKFRTTKFQLIPQRVSRVECDTKLISELSTLIQKSNDDLVILRIGRIATDYRLTIQQSINLKEHLQKYC